MPKIIIPEELYDILMDKSEEKGVTIDDFLLELIQKSDRYYKSIEKSLNKCET